MRRCFSGCFLEVQSRKKYRARESSDLIGQVPQKILEK
jgi:hypothetical protein